MKRNKRKATPRQARILRGPDRGKIAEVDQIDARAESCRVTVDGASYSMMLDGIDFIDGVDDSSDVAIIDPDDVHDLFGMID